MRKDEQWKSCKTVTLGQCGVGKTTLLYELADKRGSYDVHSRIGCDFVTRILTTEDGQHLRMYFFDTAGMERFVHAAHMSRTYLRRADVVLLVYNICDPKSYEFLIDRWFPIVDEGTVGATRGVDMHTILVGTNLDRVNDPDIPDARAVAAAEAEHWATNHGMPFVEVSCKTGEGIDELLPLVVSLTVAKSKFCGHRPVPHDAGRLGVRLPSTFEAREISTNNSSCAGGC